MNNEVKTLKSEPTNVNLIYEPLKELIQENIQNQKKNAKTRRKKRVEAIAIPKRYFSVKLREKEIRCGSDQDLMIIAGPCVIDNRKLVMKTAEILTKIAEEEKIGLIFKSSYEKDNRGSEKNWRGPMSEKGLKILADVRENFHIPVLTDIHRIEDVETVAKHVDVLQIPAYMCQQTSLAIACGETGKAINIKKGQFLAPETLSGVISKINSTGNKNCLLTERGSCFGYNRLIADMRSIPIMQGFGVPVVFDATHVIRIYGIPSSNPEGGEPSFIPYLSLAAVAAGADALFIETHPHPMEAKCDAASQLDIKNFKALIRMARRVRRAIGKPENVGLFKEATHEKLTL